MSGCLELSALCPTAEPVAVGGPGIGGEVFFLGEPRGLEIRLRMRLAGPVAEFELPEFVYEQEKFGLPEVAPCGDAVRVVFESADGADFKRRPAAPMPFDHNRPYF